MVTWNAPPKSDETDLIGRWVESQGKVVGDDTCKRIDQLSGEYLVRLADADGGWDTLFRDPADGRLWERTYPQSHMHGGGPPRLRVISIEEAQMKYVAHKTPMRRLFWQVIRQAAWAPVAVLILHAAAGSLFGHEPVVDPVMHFSGGIAACYFFRRTAEIAKPRLGGLMPLGLDLFAFGLTCSSALFWEIGEFAGDPLSANMSETPTPS